MSAVTISLFKTIIEELPKYKGSTHKVFKGGQTLNGIIRKTPSGYTGIIIDGPKIFWFTLNDKNEIKMEIRLSEHKIIINTESSMLIFTSSSVLLDYPLVKEVTHTVSDTPFWATLLNKKF